MKRYEVITIDATIITRLKVSSTSQRVLDWTKAYIKKRVPDCTDGSNVPHATYFSQLELGEGGKIAAGLFEELCHRGWLPIGWNYSSSLAGEALFKLRWEGESD
jgi:hypothetical protein